MTPPVLPVPPEPPVWEAGVTPTPHDPADDDWATVATFLRQLSEWDMLHVSREGVAVTSDGPYWQSRIAVARESVARLRARDQARTDALIEAAWSYRQKADECGLKTMEGIYRMAADTLTRIAETT